jgi:hypothetical protein
VWSGSSQIRESMFTTSSTCNEPRPTIEFDKVPAINKAPGIPGPLTNDLGRQTGLRRELARRIYHGLGFYLHARTDQQPHDPVRLRTKLLKTLPHLEQFEGDRIIITGFEMRTRKRCDACGRTIGKRMADLEDKPYVTCRNEKCVAIYHVTRVDAGTAHWKWWKRISSVPNAMPTTGWAHTRSSTVLRTSGLHLPRLSRRIPVIRVRHDQGERVRIFERVGAPKLAT